MTPHTAPPDPTTAAGAAFRWATAVPWAAQVVVALILLQTLYFKFTYAPETAYIFESRGGRPAATAVGTFELVAAALLLCGGRWAAGGAVLALGLMAGALMTHLTALGIAVKDPATGESDGGLLFALALAVTAGSLVVLGFRWRQLPVVPRLLGRAA